MTAKQKAKELFDKFRSHSHSDWHSQTGFDIEQGNENARQCCFIAIEEIQEEIGEDVLPNAYKYWKEVKQEINKL